ncbi:Anthocyanin 5-aromatic acyltransferase [Zea mays]|uniref:Anthocyanin 5-aromatic acyltransferase n=1 Tax=Zea mays TaxID=4577 RepID=A0A3L6EXG4_MAIZE|nr:Anthocyanin 5-aromatic acyltransferase [Zea mays]
MAPTLVYPVTAMEKFDVTPSPAPAAGQPRALPLTFYDLVFWAIPPVQRLFFYDRADLLDVSDFTLGELPRFRDSLAAALHHFYPLAGKLTCELVDEEGAAPPEVVFSDGDSVPLTVAVSGDDFRDLAGDHARDTARLRALLPALPQHGGSSRSHSQQGVLAVQITVFPRAGVCIGTTVHHAVADGSSYAHFLRTWATAHRLGPERSGAVAVDVPPPLFDRGVVRDDARLREAFLRDHLALGTAGRGGGERLCDWDLSRRPGVVFATFRFTEKRLRALGRRAEAETSARCSPYALACGAAWAGIVRARGIGTGTGTDGAPAPDALFGFVTGCKPRASPPVPANYFGNCLGLCRVAHHAKRGELTAVAASAAIWRAIEGLAEAGSVFRGARGWVRWVREYASARAVTVAGSPKLGLYAAADFGGAWGRPAKVEIASVERTGALALAENGRDGDGGIEVGLALPRAEMETFRAFYLDLLASLD